LVTKDENSRSIFIDLFGMYISTFFVYENELVARYWHPARYENLIVPSRQILEKIGTYKN